MPPKNKQNDPKKHKGKDIVIDGSMIDEEKVKYMSIENLNREMLKEEMRIIRESEDD